MISYTTAAVNKTLKDIKRVVYFLTILTNSLLIAYLVYAIGAPVGNLVVNILLIVATSAYLIFYMSIINKREAGKLKSWTGHAFRWFKIAMNSYSLAITLYGIFSASTRVTIFSVLLATLTAVGWLLQVIFELTYHFIEWHTNLIIEGVKADIDNFKRPFTNMSNLFSVMRGTPATDIPEEAPTKQRVYLDREVGERKEEKKRRQERRRLEMLSKFKIKHKSNTDSNSTEDNSESEDVAKDTANT